LERGEDALDLVPALLQAQHVPEDYIQLTHGEILVADDQYVDGATALMDISEDSSNRVRALLVAAEAFHDSGSTRRTMEIWEEIASRPDPATGSEVALLNLAQKAGLKSERAYPYLRRLWSHYPTTREGIAAAKALPSLESKSSRFKPTVVEMAQHGDALMRARHYQPAIDYLSSRSERFGKASPASCMAWYAQGRSHFKLNGVTRASQVLSKSGKACAGIDEDRGAKSLYLAGKSLERIKQWGRAAAIYEKLPQLYPDHSMADDGFTLSGIAWQEAGRPEHAQTLWEQQVKRYPEGDLAPEGFWRLAWTAYLDGEPEKAIEWAEQMIWKVPVETSPMHWMAAHYWSARWRIYPDVDDPSRKNTEEEQVHIGITLLADLCERYPSRYYSLLAAARLYELAPERIGKIQRLSSTGHPTVWTVREEFIDDPHTVRGIQLARLGLLHEALKELNSLPQSALLPSELALITEVEREKDWATAHDRMHKYLLHHPAAELGPDRDRLLRESYPNSYWDMIQEVAQGYRYDPRIFHALVREESSFNTEIVSFAGARGLSQLMPGTARRVAGWLKIPISNSKMFEPRTNLAIGSRYLDYLHGYFNNNHYLSVAGYNAGEGNVQKWVQAKGNIPTDEFVESIPFRETRRYVKRVMGTYQLYRMTYGTGSLYPDWSRLNHKALPDSPSP
jgi:soluble lytic murein transglycosylase